MAYMRNQHNTPYVTDYAHGGYGTHRTQKKKKKRNTKDQDLQRGDQSVVQPQMNQPSGWGSSGDQSMVQPQAYQSSGRGSSGDQSAVQPQAYQSSSWGSSGAPAGGTAWPRGYGGNDYNCENGGKEPQRDYKQTEGAGCASGGYTEGYGGSWPGVGGRTGGQLQNLEMGGGGRQWQGQETDDSGKHWQGQGRGSLRDNVDPYRPGQGRERSGTQGGGDGGRHWQGQGRGDGGFQWQGQGEGESGLPWQGQGRGDGGFQRQDQGKERTGTQLGQVVGDSGLLWRGQGRDNSGFQQQDQGKEGTGTRLGQVVDDNELLWQGQGRVNSGFQRQDQGKEGSGTQLGQVVDDGGLHKQGQGRDDSGIHWQGQGRSNRDIGWEGQGRGNSDIGWEGQGRGNSDNRWEGQGRGNGDIRWQGQVRGNSDNRLEGQGRGNGDIRWQGQGRGNSDNRWEGQGRGNSDNCWEGQGRGNSDNHWGGQGRGNSDIGWRGQGRGNSDIGLEGQGRGNSDNCWEGQGRGNSDNRWEGQGRGNSDIGWEGQGRGNSDSRWEGQGRGNSDNRWGGQGRGNSDNRWGGQGRGNSDNRWGGQGRGNTDSQMEGPGRGNNGSQWQDQGDDNDSQWLGRGGGRGGSVLGGDSGEGRGGSELDRAEGLGGSELGMDSSEDIGGSELGMDEDLDESEYWMDRRRRRRGGNRSKYKLRKLMKMQISSLAAAVGTADKAQEQGNDKEKSSEESQTSLAALLKKWQEFAKQCGNYGNAVSNMECSLTASKVKYLKLESDCKFLALCGNNNIFTAVLKVYRLDSEDEMTEDFAFLARCQGLNKKTAKKNCYDKAFKVLINSSVEEIMSQKEITEATVKQQVHDNFKKNPKEFLALLKGDTESKLEEDKKDNKRSASATVAEPAPKVSKQAELIMAMILKDNWSLAATKRIESVNPSDPLDYKLLMLKQLLKEEGITKLHIVPKIDQLSFKATIHIQNVYRFEDAPVAGFEGRTTTPVYCEVYFDGVYMCRGDADVQKHVALQHAYKNLSDLLISSPLNVLASNPRKWIPYMALDADVHRVVTKYHGKDNDSYVDSNLFEMKQLMQTVPDVKIPVQQMVLIEEETDENIHNTFKFLRLSATRNLMFLECEILKNPDLTFTCTISLQGKILATQVDSTEIEAKQLCSETAMNNLKKTQNVIYVKKEYTGRTITKSELLSNATKKKELGVPPAKIFKRITDHKEDAAAEKQDKQADKSNLPKDVTAEALFPWIAAAMYEILDEYYKKITLEDLLVDLEGMPRSHQDIVTSCAAKMGLHVETKTSKNCVLIRTLTGQDMDKILQLNGGESGRYKLMSCKNPLSKEQIEKFRNQCLEQHRKLVEARTNDDPDKHPEPSSASGSQSVKSGVSDNTWHTKYTSTGPEPFGHRPFSHRGPAPFGHRHGRESAVPLMLLDARPRMNPYPYGRYPFNRY